MKVITDLMRKLAGLGLKNISALDPSGSTRIEPPVPPHPTPANQLRLHLFSADFDSQAQADRFCYEAPQPDYPEQLTRELEGAFIDTAEVEVIHDAVLPRLREFLSDREADDILLRMGGDNSLIIITELAFGGLPYTLDDTETLTYLGPIMVET